MFQTLLIPTAIPHRCSFGSFIGLHFKPLFFLLLLLLLLQHLLHPSSPLSVFIRRFVSGSPNPVRFNHLQANLFPTLVFKPVVLIGHSSIRGVVDSLSVPGMTLAHCDFTIRLREMNTVVTGGHFLQRCP